MRFSVGQTGIISIFKLGLFDFRRSLLLVFKIDLILLVLDLNDLFSVQGI
jgi:hypothetical protein